MKTRALQNYKVRRAASNLARKNLNKNITVRISNEGPSTRANRVGKGVVAYSYGNGLRNHFSKKHLEELKARKQND